MSIDWQPINTARSDQREILLAVRNTLGTADGGDGIALNPQHPFLYYIATWTSDALPGGRWLTSAGGAYDEFYLERNEPSWWADIVAPEPHHSAKRP